MTEKTTRDHLEYMAYEFKRGMGEFKGRLSDEERQNKILSLLDGFGNGMLYDASDKNGLTLLHTCSSYDSVPSIETLIGFGMDKFSKDIDGNTLLHHAFTLTGPLSYGGFNGDVLHWAVQNGFDINIKNNLGQTPLFLLGHFLSHYDPARDEYIEDFDEGDSHEYQLFIQDLIDIFEKLGGDIYHKDHQGRTFVDCVPSQNPQWALLDPALVDYRRKIEKQMILDEVSKPLLEKSSPRKKM